jgi:hypothetical protein
MTTELLPTFDLAGLRWDSVPPSLRPWFNTLLQDEDFVGPSTHRDQTDVAMHSLWGDEDDEPVAYSALTVFFGIAKGSIEWQAQRYHEAIRGTGRPRTLQEAAHTYITEAVQVRFTEQKPATDRLLQDTIEWHFNFSMSIHMLRHVCKNMPGVKMVVGLPMDRARVQCHQNANHLQNPLDPLASDAFACKEAIKPFL